MSLWRDLKRATVATASVLGHTVSLATTAAEYLNAAAGQLEIRIRITQLETLIDEHDGVIPAREMQQNIEELLQSYDELAKVASHQEASELADKKAWLLDKLVALEERRKTVKRSAYPSGAPASYMELYDGERHGVTRYWYDGGVMQTQANYAYGRLCGGVRHWFPSGRLMIDGTLPSEGLIWKMNVFRESGSGIFQLTGRGLNGLVKIWLWDGTLAGVLHVSNGKLGKAGCMFRMLLNPALWRSVWVAWRAGVLRKNITEMNDVSERASKLFEKIK